MERPSLALTHAGHFHADDVFSAALLREVWPGLEIRRAYEVPEGFDGLAFDVGGGAFDHHGPERKLRQNGIPYAAFGLLWQELGEQLVGAEQAKWLDEHFIQPLDKDDNTGCGDSLADAIGGFNPVWDSDADADACFWRAEAFAAQVLKNRLEGSPCRQPGQVAGGKGPCQNERQRGGAAPLRPWKTPSRARRELGGLPLAAGRLQRPGGAHPRRPQAPAEMPLPRELGRAARPQLERVSGIRGLRFCHASGFLVSTNTLESALAACRAAAPRQRRSGAPRGRPGLSGRAGGCGSCVGCGGCDGRVPPGAAPEVLARDFFTVVSIGRSCDKAGRSRGRAGGLDGGPTTGQPRASRVCDRA